MSLRIVLCILVLASLGLGQYETAAIIGAVKDPSTAGVPGATVRLESLETGVTASARSNESGDYQFLNVRLGTYRIRVEKAGFKTSVTDGFDVAVNARQRVDVNMELGAASESVSVSGAASILETESSDRGQVIGQEAVENLPLNGRSYADLTLLAPGVRKSMMMVNGQRDSSYNVNGMQAALNNFVLDGLDNNAYNTANPGLSNQRIQLSPDAVQEFKVQTDNYSAEYGRTAGAVINAATRGGTNEFHGSAWDYLRNTALNAVGFFKPLGGVKPVLIQNQFGGTVGAPIRKDKMFFFADYEGFRRVTKQLTYATIPSLDQRNGIFTLPIQNPYAGSLYPNAVIPQSQITDFGRKVLGDLPAPNLPGTANNYQWLPRANARDDKGDFRYDYYITDRVSMFARYSKRDAAFFTPATVPGPSGGSSVTEVPQNWQFAGGPTWIVNPRSVVDFRFAVSDSVGARYPAGRGQPGMLALYGIPGLPSDPNLDGGLNTQRISGYANMGSDNSSPQHENPLVVNPKVNYSRTMGRQILKMGYEFQAINTEVDDFHPKYGADTYAGQFSRPSGVATSSLYSVADFLVGARDTYSLDNIALAHYRQRMDFFYVQDDYKVSPRLTLNLGVRYEFATPQYERDNHLSNYDPVTQSLILAKNGSLYDRALVHPDYDNWAPRVGFALSVTPRTVIRSGYGISYIEFNRMGGDNMLAYNGPFVVNPTVTQDPSQGLCSANLPPSSCFRPTQLGYPLDFATVANFSTAVSKVNYTPANEKTSYVQSWHFTVQREITSSMVLELGYTGNHSVGLLIFADYNQAAPNLQGQNIPLAQRRPIPGFSFIEVNFNGGFASYDGLQVKLEKRYSAGLYLLNSFTWSKALDDAPGHMEQFNGDIKSVDLYGYRSWKGVSSYDQPLNDTATIIYELPFGRARGNGVLKTVAEGWRLTAINTMTSGLPINLTYNPSAQASVSSFPSYRPNITGNPMEPAGQRNIYRYFNPVTVAIPNYTQPFGNAGRNIGRSNALLQLDCGVHRQFPLGAERRQLEFRAEMFNALNRTNFMAADGNRSDAGFGTITSTFPARQIQLALRFGF